MDEELPIVSVSDITVLEGTGEPTIARFEITLSQPSDETIEFTALTQDNSDGNTAVVAATLDRPINFLAVNGVDVVPVGQTLTIEPGETSVSLDVDVVGDDRFEADEDFGLLLFGFTGATGTAVTSGGDPFSVGVATVLNDDPRPAFTGANALVMDIDGLGRVIMHLRPDLAPLHVERMVELADQEYYDGRTFNRVIEDFVAQGGFPGEGDEAGTGVNLPAEFSSEPYVRGSVGMARVGDQANSADDQFFIGLENTASLANLTGRFTLFGRVEQGMDKVDALPRSTVLDDGTEVPPANPGVIANMESRVLTEFDPVGYLQANPDVAAAGFTVDDAVTHLQATGTVENRPVFFDGALYLDANPDVAAAGFTEATAISHYLDNGRAEGRLTAFDGTQYLRMHPDVAAAGLTPEEALGHFQAFGKAEGRLPEFDDIAYLLANPDVEAAGLTSFEEALAHFRGPGRSEGRGIFDGETYLQVNGDVAAAGFLAETHFAVAGRGEGRALALKGTIQDDLLIGRDGPDILRGLSGDDKIDGGDGEDIAVFDDVRSQFSVARSDGDEVVVKHLRGDLDVDTLVDIELVKFTDQLVALDDLIA
ncbi:MAG: hypothetical protein GVY13_08485 [Alphaproteobacteria bacterium]|jgi:peptidylprolyl isomerase|nr:hypothetical protein [Alphaproteobacteria bacterium]